MAIKTYRPTTQTLRYRTTLVNDDITTATPHKPLVEPKQRTGGRRNSGDTTMRLRGGGTQAQAAHRSISSATSTGFRRRSRRLSTIRTARRASRC